MKNEFVLAFNEVLEEKQLPKEIILKALESAMVSAYRKAVNASNAQIVEAKVDPDSGKVTIFAEKEVVDSVQDDRTEVTLTDALRVNPEAEMGGMVVVESTPRDFGRVAAQTARQVIQQRIRDAERNAQLEYYQKQLGEIVSGAVQAVSGQGLTIGLEMRTESIMQRKDMIPGERFRIHDRVRALVSEVKDSPRGPQIVLSRTHRDFLRRLLENEVPEIYHGVVEIKSIAREPGERAKVAVSATQSGIDPVGACVGIRGVRIQAIVRELNNEKIDVIEWNNDPTVFIAKAISPARVNGVYLTDKSGSNKTATVVVPEDQLSLAIGRDGQNARLAAKLTSWRIDIKSLSEAAADTSNKLRSDVSLVALAQAEKDVMALIVVMLAKKAEGRPLNPEEYDQMAKFVDRVERRIIGQRTPEKKLVVDEAADSLRKSIPDEVFDQKILDSSISDHVAFILQEAGYTSVGEIYLQIKKSPDDVLRLQGIGPKAMAEINRLVESVDKAVETAKSPAAVESVPAAAVEAVVEPVVETVGETAETAPVPVAAAEPQDETIPSITVAAPGEAQAVVEEEEEEETSLEKYFTLKPEMIQQVPGEESEEDDTSGKKSGKTKKKKKGRRVEYDPDRDITTVHVEHKRGEGWEWDT